MNDRTKEYIHDVVKNPRAHFSAQELRRKGFNLPHRTADLILRGSSFLGASAESTAARRLEITTYAKQLIHAKSYEQ